MRLCVRNALFGANVIEEAAELHVRQSRTRDLPPQTRVLSLTKLSPLTDLNCESALAPGFKSLLSLPARTEAELEGREMRKANKECNVFLYTANNRVHSNAS